MTITDTNRRIAAALGEAVGLMTGSYASSARSAYNTWAGQPTFSDQDRATLAAIFAEGLTAITTPGATPGKLEPVVNLTFDQIKQGMRRWVTEYRKEGKRAVMKTVRQVDYVSPRDGKSHGYIRYTDGTDEYVTPDSRLAFLADSVPSKPEPTWVTQHISVPHVLPGMVTDDGTRIKDVVVRTSLATGEKTYDVQYPDFEDADLGRHETIGVRCDRVSRLPLIPRT